MSTQTIEQRCEAFLEKVEGRLDQVSAEAAEAFADVASDAPLDPTPIYSMEAALQARFQGLSDRLDDAWDQLDAELDDARVRASLRARVAAVGERIQEAHERCRVTSLAAIGETLQGLAQGEDQTVRCTACGGPIAPGTVYQTTNLRCPHCSAVNAVGPGPAMMQWYSRGTAYLAEAEALEPYLAYRAAESTFNELRHPTTDDLEALLDTYRTWHRTKTDALVRLHPAWTREQADNEVDGTVGKLRAIHALRSAEMARTAAGLQVAAERKPELLEKWARSESPGMGRTIVLDHLLEAAIERGLRPEADTVVRVVHKDELPWLFGRDRWVRAKLRELSPALA